MLAWFLIERFIESCWDRYLDVENQELKNGQKRISSIRRKSLKDNRSYPISVKLQILELSKQISFEQYLAFDKLRRARNEIVHPEKNGSGNSGIEGDPDNCNLAFELLQQFLEDDLDVSLTLNRSYSFLGIFKRE